MLNPNSKNPIEKFFATYEKGANTFDPDLVTTEFADCFIGADPNGTVCIQNNAEFRAAIPQRQEMFKQIGFKSAEILSLDETPLDDHYKMVKVRWHMIFEKETGKPLDFKFYNTYFLFQKDDEMKVVFYISHDDEEKVMRESGLIPAQQPEKV